MTLDHGIDNPPRDEGTRRKLSSNGSERQERMAQARLDHALERGKSIDLCLHPRRLPTHQESRIIKLSPQTMRLARHEQVKLTKVDETDLVAMECCVCRTDQVQFVNDQWRKVQSLRVGDIEQYGKIEPPCFEPFVQEATVTFHQPHG